jgi:hypothetical protein
MDPLDEWTLDNLVVLKWNDFLLHIPNQKRCEQVPLQRSKFKNKLNARVNIVKAKSQWLCLFPISILSMPI